jgi:nicotinate-nucleotide pyrophosphorylase (carboxylating)
VTNQSELRQALELDVQRILLDNMSLSELRAAVQLVAGRVPLEASGNVSLQNVAEVAATGVDYISVGALTHSVRALDISLEVKQAQ